MCSLLQTTHYHLCPDSGIRITSLSAKFSVYYSKHSYQSLTPAVDPQQLSLLKYTRSYQSDHPKQEKYCVVGNKNQIKWNFVTQETPLSFCLAGGSGERKGEGCPVPQYLSGVLSPLSQASSHSCFPCVVSSVLILSLGETPVPNIF